MTVKNQQDKTWTFDNKCRWKITATLQTLSPLHIGNGEIIEKDFQGENQSTKANAIIRGKQNKPLIPGSSIKGKLRRYLKEGVDAAYRNELNYILGKSSSEEHKGGKGGLAEFHDALQLEKVSPENDLPNWDYDNQTFFKASTAIDRHTRTAKDASLHYTEYLPAGMKFQFTVTGDMTESQAGLLIYALRTLANKTNTFRLGANDSNGYGRIELHNDFTVEKLDKTDIFNWLKTNSESQHITKSFKKIDDIDSLEKIAKEKFNPKDLSETSYKLSLQFSSPFIVNDPSKNTGAKDEADHQLLTDEQGNPAFPSTSIRGALRSQAERIIRTMGGECCDTEEPCQCKQGEYQKLCLACQLFGTTGWKTTLQIDQFEYQGSGGKNKQQFVAIDRFHGGGKDTALFSSEYTIRPKFTGNISLNLRNLDEPELTWRKGLLALLFRDLKEGDINFGMARNKAYGIVESAEIVPENFTNADITAFREKITADPLSGNSAETPKTRNEGNIDFSVATGYTGQVNGFHNPYNFIPVKTPNKAHWLDKTVLIEKDKKKASLHSHAYYRSQTDKGEAVYHGRIQCKLTAETPFFIGQGEEPNQDNNAAKVQTPYQHDGQLAIPATSLRGMISSLVEAASNSAMRVLDEEGVISYRKEAGDALRKIGIVHRKDGDWKITQLLSNTANAITLKNVYGDDKNQEMADFIEGCSSWSPQNNIVYYMPKDDKGSIPQEKYNHGMICGILRILGKDDNRTNELENKKNELFISIDEQYIDTDNNTFNFTRFISDQGSLPFADGVYEKYTELANQRTYSQKSDAELKKDEECISTKWLPFHLKGASRLEKSHKNGKVCMLPLNEYDLVYFDSSRDKKVTEVAFSAIWRDKNKDKIHAFFPDKELQPFNKERKKISPAELLFGFVELEEKTQTRDHAQGYMGKVRINTGQLTPNFANKDKKDLLDDEVMLKALSSPKPPSPAFYFKSKNGNNYIAKKELDKNKHEINGRKNYLHALRKEDQSSVQKIGSKGTATNGGESEYPWVSQANEPNRNKLRVKIRPIKIGTSFEFSVDFDNLTKWELGLLCYALKPNETYRHKIGMGKPIGLGSVNIEVQSIQCIDRVKRYKEDSIEADRYNGENWSENLSNDWLNELRQQFIETMDVEIQQAIEILGNPANVKCPVHYPQITGKNIEKENFEWFVKNDKDEKQSLNPITVKDGIPILEKYQT